MTLISNANQSSEAGNNERNEKYRLLISVLEKKCGKITKDNEKIAAR